MTVEQLTHDALALPEEDRERLAHALLDSLRAADFADDEDRDESVSQEQIDREWAEEIQRRREQIRRGEVRMMTRDEYRAEMEDAIRQVQRSRS